MSFEQELSSSSNDSGDDHSDAKPTATSSTRRKSIQRKQGSRNKSQ